MLVPVVTVTDVFIRPFMWKSDNPKAVKTGTARWWSY